MKLLMIFLIFLTFSCQTVHKYQLPPIPEKPTLIKTEDTASLFENTKRILEYCEKLEAWCYAVDSLVSNP